MNTAVIAQSPEKAKSPRLREEFADIDPLAPYHFEACYCAKCAAFTKQPEKTT